MVSDPGIAEVSEQESLIPRNLQLRRPYIDVDFNF